MSDRDTSHERRHPIGVVATRTGLPQDLIRAWERRYHAVTPGRGGTGRRLYSDADIERLRLLRRAVAGGRRISDVAELPLDALCALVADDHPDTRAAPGAAPFASVSPQTLVSEAVQALEAFDRHGFEGVLAEARVLLSGPVLRQQVIVPLLEVIGQRWQDGTLRVVHEHLASAIVRSFMGASHNGHDRQQSPRIIVTTPTGQHHELGALMAAAIAEEGGWDVYYLGPDLPAEEIAAAVRQLNARAVALSVVYQNGDRAGDEIVRLRHLVGPVPIFVGGRATGPLAARLSEAGVACPPDLAGFRAQLQSVLA